MLATLGKLNLTENTLVVLMSDNGGYLNYRGGFENISSNGPLKGQKGEVDEGGHRVPAIFHWPGKIAGGEVYASNRDDHGSVSRRAFGWRGQKCPATKHSMASIWRRCCLNAKRFHRERSSGVNVNCALCVADRGSSI